ncbi:MAG: radical SAM protein [Oscillospiraceae bacterium]|nr:radical SAM protein [Oscillospiraceae bacterium]
MNKYINLNRLEFFITNACTGKCKHCSEYERLHLKESINAEAAVNVIKKLEGKFALESVMTFGGEPLLFADTVCAVHTAANDSLIPERQLITNGFFSENEQKIDEVAEKLCCSGVNSILISVDVFHQEFIPLETVMKFAEAVTKYGIPSILAHPSWVVSEIHENPYNTETKELLKTFTDKGFGTSKGNHVFPFGAALNHLNEYFPPPEEIDLSVPCGSAPYTTRLDNIDCFGINPNGDVRLCALTIGNIYEDDILNIVENYDPHKIAEVKALLEGGVSGLLHFAKLRGIEVDISKCRSACGVCKKVMEALTEKNKMCRV